MLLILDVFIEFKNRLGTEMDTSTLALMFMRFEFHEMVKGTFYIRVTGWTIKVCKPMSATFPL
jgi:hypothetical protein